jgi:hypothetical protein
MSKVEIRKVGIERAIATFADSASITYGLLTVFISVAMGWLAGRLFSLA